MRWLMASAALIAVVLEAPSNRLVGFSQAAEGRDIVRQHKPVVYQEIHERQQPIDVGYIVDHDGHVKLWERH